MSSISAVLQNRTPLSWVITQEPERVVSFIPFHNINRDIYIFDPDKGLMVWSHAKSHWLTVLITKADPDSGMPVDVPIFVFEAAFSFLLETKNSVFIIRNAHQIVKDFATYFSVFFSRFRDAFNQDNLDSIPLQIICLSPEEPAPVEIAAMTSTIEIGPPTPEEIAVIISQISKSCTETDVLKDQNVDRIIRSSVGMSELDIIEFYFHSIRTKDVISEEEVDRLRMERLKAISSLEIVRPNVSLDDVGGLDKAKELILRAKWIRDNPERAKELRVSPLRRVLLLGLPGTGKSCICQAAATTLGLDLAKIGIARALNSFVGQSEKNMRIMFDHIKMVAPIAAWIDEIGRDLSGGGSSNIVDGGTTSRVHGEFLTGLQELPENVFLFAAANSVADLAPEMLRADRFDAIMFVGFPSYEERKEILRLNLDTEADYNIDALAEHTTCYTGAEIKACIQTARNTVSIAKNRHPNTDEILAVIRDYKNTIWKKHNSFVINNYQIALSQHDWASTEQREEASLIVAGKMPGLKKTTTQFTLR